MGTDLHEWVHFLNGLTPETIILPANCTNNEIDATIWYLVNTPAPPIGYAGRLLIPQLPKTRERPGDITGVFVRYTQASPKYFSPCKNSTEVRLALLAEQGLEYRGSPICIRRWLPNIKTEYAELRCFISEGKFTAVSQYDYYNDGDPIMQPVIIKKLALGFIPVVQARLKGTQFANCTIDIAINIRSYNCIVIDIGPSHKIGADTALFSDCDLDDMLALDIGSDNTPFRYYADEQSWAEI